MILYTLQNRKKTFSWRKGNIRLDITDNSKQYSLAGRKINLIYYEIHFTNIEKN